MVIEGDFYRLTPIDDTSPFWDLEILKTIKSKTKPRTEFVNAGYGMTLESAIAKIIQYAICSKHDKLTLKEYLDEYTRVKRTISITP